MVISLFKKDNFKFGLILGFLGPIVGCFIYYFAKTPSAKLIDYLSYLMKETDVLTSIGTMSLLMNSILFTIYINTAKDNTAKGIFVTTLIYGITIFLYKILR